MTPDVYVGRCKGLVISVAESLPPDEVGSVMHLIDHGEPAEGLASLAWSIESARGVVEGDVASLIIELIDGLVPTESLPQSVQGASLRGERKGLGPCAQE